MLPIFHALFFIAVILPWLKLTLTSTEGRFTRTHVYKLNKTMSLIASALVALTWYSLGGL